MESVETPPDIKFDGNTNKECVDGAEVPMKNTHRTTREANHQGQSRPRIDRHCDEQGTEDMATYEMSRWTPEER